MTSICAPLPVERRPSGGRAILSPDGRLLAVSGERHTVLVFDATTNEPWVTYYGHQAGVYRRVSGTITVLAWLPDGSSIASGSSDGSIHLWHGRSGIHQRTLAQPQEDCAVLALILSGDGCLTALRGRDVTTWHLNS
jgi:WD40 repeat protein